MSRNLLTIAAPLLKACELTDDDLNADFFKSIYPNDQDILAEKVFFDLLPVVRRHFASNHFYGLATITRWVLPPLCREDPEKVPRWMFCDNGGDLAPQERAAYDTRSRTGLRLQPPWSTPIINDLHLPAGQPIPNDCPMARHRPSGATRRPMQPVTVNFEVIPDPATSTGTHITEAGANSQAVVVMDTPLSYTTYLHGQEGLMALKGVGWASVAASLPASHDSHFVYSCDNIDRPPNYHPPHHGIFERKLDCTRTSAASLPVCKEKELVERLRARCVETGSFEQVADDTSEMVSVPGLVAKREA
ncbi:hypothetical protein BJY52DRAFT_1215457, partial [Lactarius psammicola]